MSEELSVWLHGRELGFLRRKRNGASFGYLAALTEELPGAPLLSVALPVRNAAFDAAATRSWFTGLLPESEQLQEVQRRFRLESADYLSLLAEIGWECAGAVVITRTGTAPPPGALQEIDGRELARRLRALPSRPFDPDSALRVSLGGYQAKMLVTRTPAGWALPLGGAISTHILKPQPATSWPGLIESEAWAMTAAASVTPTAEVEVLQPEDAPLTLVVTRFDRETTETGDLQRLHQEDAAQAMGLPPETKYARSGAPSRSDPSYLRIAGILERYGTSPTEQLRRLLTQVTVNTALGNTDAHAKNYALLHPTRETVELSPMYDVAPTFLINPTMPEMGLRVDNTLLLERVTGRKLISEGVSWGMTPVEATSIVTDTLDALESGTVNATQRFPDAETLYVYAKAQITKLRETI